MHEQSKIEILRSLPIEKRKQFLQSLSDIDALNFKYDWMVNGRPKQLEGLLTNDYFVHLVLCGRGFGKTKMGSETVRYYVERGTYGRIALLAGTAADARDVMIEGESGILATAHPNFRPTYNPSQRKLTWPNGAIAQAFSAEAYEALRGVQFDYAWVDELAKFPYQQEAWDQLMFGLRLGRDPKVLVTTTPRPTELIKNLASDPSTLLTTGSTFENSANLAPQAIEQMRKRYEGTRIGRQELYAEMLLDNVNALFNQDNIDQNRIDDAPDLIRIVVAIDPAVTNNANSDETGIVVAGRSADGKGYILHDGSMKGTPNEWATKALKLYELYKADLIVAEVNNGGLMVNTIISHLSPYTNYKDVRATRGKVLRAEPITALYERNLIHHVGHHNLLEAQMCDFDPTLGSKQKSPDKLDALVWALTELFPEQISEPTITLL